MANANPIEIQKYLKGLNYPASKDELVSQAKTNGADDESVSLLERLDSDSFETPADVSQVIGKLND